MVLIMYCCPCMNIKRSSSNGTTIHDDWYSTPSTHFPSSLPTLDAIHIPDEP